MRRWYCDTGFDCRGRLLAQTVLVIGGAGYIGAHAVRDLQAAGHDVVVFDDDGAMKNLWGTAPKETWSECSEFSEAGSDELRVYGLDSQGS